MKDVTKKNQLLYISIIFPAIIVLLIVFFLIPIDPGAKGSSSPKTPQMKKLAVKIGRLETEVHEKQDELIKLSKLYSQKTNEPLPVLKGLGLSDSERKILEDKIINEKDASIKSLLKDILEKNREISELKIEIAKYEAFLPEPHIAVEGENHSQISMDFLINKKNIKKEKAAKLVEETLLFDPLIPGFKVWNFYADGEFGTFVTQGSAAMSPIELRKTLGNEAEILSTQINGLKSVRDQLESQIKDLQRELNSLFYMVDLEENLLKKGIIKKGEFLGLKVGSPKLKKISPANYDQKIDLREKDIIEIYANQFNLGEIKKVTLYPGFYNKDVDYKIEIEEDKKKAIVKILIIEKFRRDRIVISVE